MWDQSTSPIAFGVWVLSSESYFCQLQSTCCFTGSRAGQASGTHQMCGAHSQGRVGSDRSPCQRWPAAQQLSWVPHLPGRCVHRPDGVGWDDFLPLCSSLQRGAVNLGPREQPELGVLFPVPLFLLLPPSPSVLSLSLGARGPRRTSVLCIPREGPCASPALILSRPDLLQGPAGLKLRLETEDRSWGSCSHPTMASNPVSSRPGSWLCLPLGLGVGSCRRRLPALPEVTASCCPVSSAGTVLQ